MSGTVSIIDTATDKVVGTINVGQQPHGVTVSSDAKMVYITNRASDTVSVINTSTNAVIDTWNVGDQPLGVVVTPNGEKAYVTCNSAVYVINTSTNNLITTLNVSAYGIVVNSEGTRVYLASDIVSVIDTATDLVIATVPPGINTANTMDVVVSMDGKKVYATHHGSKTVSVIDATTNNITVTINVGNNPTALAVNSIGTRVYVSNGGDNSVSVIDAATNNIIATIPVGNWPSGVSLTPDGKKVYVTNQYSNNVNVIDADTNTIIGTVNVENNPVSLGQFIVPAKYTPSPILPVANFTANVISGYAPLTIQFTDLSTNATE